MDITFKTMHASKGLEADYVIVLGMGTGRYAFPSEISDDPLLQLVMPQAESFPNAEERRLFYVALTRARRGVYLLANSYSPSAFLSELAEDESLRSIVRDEQEESGMRGSGVTNARAATCPRCQRGRLTIKTGMFGAFLGCSTFPRCRYTRNVADAA